jgi:hypothetical protein
MPTALTTYASVVAEQALPLLFKNAKTHFPPGTALTGFPEIKDNVMSVHLTRQFLQPNFWISKTQLTSSVYAIVNTALEAYSEKDNRLEVQLIIDGATSPKLLTVDLSKHLTPRDDLVVARAKTSAGTVKRATSQPVARATHVSAAVRLDPQFHFVPKYFSFSRINDYYSKHELVAFGLKLGYRGPKPDWWPNRVSRYTSAAFFTNTGKKFVVPLNRLNTEAHSDDEDGLFVTDTAVVVPGLNRQMRVKKMELVLPVQGRGSTKVTISIPPNRHENQDRS